jgi:GAF domain-containing protein
LSEFVADKERSSMSCFDPDIDLLAVPVRGETVCWGVLRCAIRFQGHPKQLFSQEKEDVLSDLGGELGIAIDRRHAEELERAKRQQLIRETTLENIKEFAHDLKNPAASIDFLGGSLQKHLAAGAVPSDARRAVEQLTYIAHRPCGEGRVLRGP